MEARAEAAEPGQRTISMGSDRAKASDATSLAC